MSRIIAGSAGGMRLATPPGEKTRPTTDRVREALFSTLATWNGSSDAGADAQLAGIAFCDLYAGSGGVGLEAASRGASPVVLVEQDQPTARIIKANAGKTKLSAQVVVAGVDSFLARDGGQPFDVIWLDPPYPFTNEQISRTLAMALPRLVHNGLIVLERSARSGEPVLPEGTEHWSRGYGETTLHFCQREANDDQ
ncbi:16S rRNA (guanine(966)-N(2))-methyltransferase RsmD [Luteococcus japonicus]|uniref:16S rRNA (Guanine(966)-N(2))-methyltransferaseG966 n=1 Tax=Luteococcus japonicus LSP_Lj1 TaxID=1255658 RepID=A0A1R4J5I2_9ACTN|nr:16S rRNA (guanine(966)-N(2))-methyltransferase RsmD [Luteococcus japonicus]SJN27346.1 16S rRNA (guanine(966)-N(2))-methyltransferaseG966 [Luteococcus japonicus LSP_Lj1]